jgi:hypothetical protein
MTRLLALVAAIAACLLIPASAFAGPENDRTGFWRLNEASGTTAVDSVGSHNGTYVGSPALGVGGATRDSDTAVHLDGADDWVTTSWNPFANGTTRSFEGWAKRDSTTSYDMLFGGTGSRAPVFYLQQNSTNARFWPDSGIGSSITWTNIPTNAWFHWVLVFDEPNDSVELFVNGVSKGVQTTTTPYNASPGNLTLGYTTVDNPFGGSLDDVAVYDRALTSTEVGQLYGSIEQLNDSRDAFWRLNEASGTTAVDNEGAHNGTYVGSPTLGAAGATTDSDTAVHLDGGDDRVTTSWNPFANGTTRSFEGWAKRDSTTSYDMLFGGTGARAPVFYLQQNSTNARFWPDSGIGSSITWTNIPTGVWFHWVLVFDEENDRVELFVNGVSKGVQTTTTPYNASPGNLTLGYTTVDNPFSGSLDDVAVYDRALSPTEAAGLATPISFKDSFEASTFPKSFAWAAWCSDCGNNNGKLLDGTGGHIDQVTPSGFSATDGTKVVDAGLTSTSTRAEIQCHRAASYGSDNNCAGGEGTEWVYEFDVRIPSGTTLPGRATNLMQTKPTTVSPTPPGHVAGSCYGGGLQVQAVPGDSSKVEYLFSSRAGAVIDDGYGFCTTSKGTLDSLGTFPKGSWQHFKLRAKWSVDPAVGFVQAWMDGVERLPRRLQSTLIDGTGRVQMFRLGLYESLNASNYHATFNVFYDDLVVRKP